MMITKQRLRYAEVCSKREACGQADIQVVELPYGEERRFVATILMPTIAGGADLDALVGAVAAAPTLWEHWLSPRGLRSREVSQPLQQFLATHSWEVERPLPPRCDGSAISSFNDTRAETGRRWRCRCRASSCVSGPRICLRR